MDENGIIEEEIEGEAEKIENDLKFEINK